MRPLGTAMHDNMSPPAEQTVPVLVSITEAAAPGEEYVKGSHRWASERCVAA